MSARMKIQKSLQVGAYASVVFQPSATGEHIQRAVETLQLTGLTINGLVEVHADELGPQEPPHDPRIYNQKLPDGTYPSVKAFFTQAAATPPPAEKLPPEFINVSETDGQWFVDRVTPHYIETLGRKPTQRGALAFARARARRFGLTIHEGPHVWESAKPTPTRTFGFTESELEWGDRECDARRGT